jgi:hypothetical protein
MKRNLEITQMANKRKPTKKCDPNQITSVGKPDEDRAVAVARAVLRPTVQAATTLKGMASITVSLICQG